MPARASSIRAQLQALERMAIFASSRVNFEELNIPVHGKYAY
jgi:hypothetical protein